MKKKLLSIVLSLCLIIPCLLSLTACNNGNLKTMDVSVNPEMSFVVNGNKVVNVIFENDDAGTIYANVDFAGMSVESALKVVIEQSVISGHFTFNGEEIELEVAGSNDAEVEKLKNTAKQKIEEVCNSLGVQVTVDAEALKAEARKTALVAKASLLAPEYSQAELEEKTEKQLLEIIKTKQNELKGLAYSQIEDIKEAFGKAENAILAQIENLRSKIDEQYDLLQAKQAELEQITIESLRELAQQAIDGYKTAINTFKTQLDNAIESYLNAKAQAIQQAKTQYETLKTQLVNAYKQQVAQANAALVSHLDAKLADGTITQAQYDYWVNLANQNKQ